MLSAVAVPSDVNVPTIPDFPSDLPTFTPALIFPALRFAMFPVIFEFLPKNPIFPYWFGMVTSACSLSCGCGSTDIVS